MASMAKVILIGNVGRDCELRYTASGSAMGAFSLAVNNRKKNNAGEWEDQTEWFNCTIFGDTAERISQFVVKGKQLYVEGRITMRSWTDDKGQKHERMEVIANSVQLLGQNGGKE